MAGTMSCPKCDQALIRVTTDHGVFWRCDACRGVAIGVQALRRTFARDQINAVWQRAREEEGSPAAACPSCRNQMIEVTATDAPEPRIEVCRICHFLWFDADELAHFAPLPPKPPPPREPELPADAREALAMAEIDLISRRAKHADAEVDAEIWRTFTALLRSL